MESELRVRELSGHKLTLNLKEAQEEKVGGDGTNERAEDINYSCQVSCINDKLSQYYI